jgi:hypothetical protein
MNKAFHNLFRVIELAASVAIVIVAITLVATIYKQGGIGRKPQAANSSSLRSGDVLRVSDLDLTTTGQPTLVLALSTQCRFCTESVPFYRRLLARARELNINVIVLMPQPETDARTYLKEHALDVSRLHRLDTSTNISGVPTVIALNSSGVIKHIWVGKLGTTQEDAVLSGLELG